MDMLKKVYDGLQMGGGQSSTTKFLMMFCSISGFQVCLCNWLYSSPHLHIYLTLCILTSFNGVPYSASLLGPDTLCKDLV